MGENGQPLPRKSRNEGPPSFHQKKKKRGVNGGKGNKRGAKPNAGAARRVSGTRTVGMTPYSRVKPKKRVKRNIGHKKEWVL